MSQLEVFGFDGELVVDSRLIAESLGIQHESFMVTAKKYQSQVERAFEVFRFQTGKPPPGSKGGRRRKCIVTLGLGQSYYSAPMTSLHPVATMLTNSHPIYYS